LSQAAVAELEIDVQPARQLVQDRDARGHEPHALGVEVDARGHLVAGGAREQLEGALEGPPAELRPHDAAHRGGAAADGDGAIRPPPSPLRTRMGPPAASATAAPSSAWLGASRTTAVPTTSIARTPRSRAI